MPILHRNRIPQGERDLALQLPDLSKLLLPPDHYQVVLWQERGRQEGRQKLEKHPKELHVDAESALRVGCAELAHHRSRTGKFQNNTSNISLMALLSNPRLFFKQFNKFERRSLKYMRIYLKQPSPNWLEYNLRDLQVYLKKMDRPNTFGATATSYQQSSENKSQLNPFNQFKSQIKRNLKNMKKDQDQQSFT